MTYGDYDKDKYETYPADVEVALASRHGDKDVDVHDAELAESNPLFRAFKGLFNKGVEARGIERVPEDERDSTHFIGLLVMWWGVNTVISTFPIGLLAQAYFNLSFQSAVAAIVTFTAIGAACCGFIATLGPQTGLRTIVITRYSMGMVGGTIFALFNILTQLGFSSIAVILGGQILSNVSDDKIPLEASIVIVGFIGLFLCFVGYNGEFRLLRGSSTNEHSCSLLGAICLDRPVHLLLLHPRSCSSPGHRYRHQCPEVKGE